MSGPSLVEPLLMTPILPTSPSSLQATRHDWSVAEIEALLEKPLLDLVYQAQTLHRQTQDDTVQLASLLSIKTGGCPEDCGYCPQSAHYAKETGVAKEPLMAVDAVMEKARIA